MINAHIVAMTCSTPTQAVHSNECLMAGLHTGHVLGMMIADTTGKIRNRAVFHIWDDEAAQLRDPRLKNDLKKFLKMLGGAHILDHDGRESLQKIDRLLQGLGMDVIDRPISSILPYFAPYDTLDALAVNLGVPDFDRLKMTESSKSQLNVLELTWKAYLKTKLQDVCLMDTEDDNSWRRTLTPADKRRITLMEKETHMDDSTKAIALLASRGVCDSVLSRLEVSRATDGI